MCREDANVSLDKLHGFAENGMEEQLKQLGFDVSNKVRVAGRPQIPHDTEALVGYRDAFPTSRGTSHRVRRPRLSRLFTQRTSESWAVHYNRAVRKPQTHSRQLVTLT